MTKVQVVKRLVKQGLGLPEAIKIYNRLSANGFYEIDRKDLNKYIKENF